MADVELQALELKVVGNSSDAKQHLDTLIDTLGKLDDATKDGCGLDALVKSMGRVSDAADKLDSNMNAKLTSLAKGLSALSKVSGLKLSSSIANQITAIGTAIGNQSGVDYGKMSELANALKPLETLGKSNLGSTLGQLKKLPDVATALDQVDLTSFKAKVIETADAMRPLADEMQKVANGFSAFPVQIQKYLDSGSKIPANNNASALSFAKLATKVTAAYLALRKGARIIASWINESNSYVENMNLFNVAMGQYATDAMTYANKVSEAMGIDPSEWIRAQGVFMTLSTGFGVAGNRASEMSEKLTQLGYDLSSFYNISVSEAMSKLKSGLAGELEPLRGLGYDLSQAKLEAIALSLGIDKTVSSMTQAEKAELRYYAIMTQVTQVHGDMARTLEDPANQLRIFNAQLNMAARSLGNIFIPALNAVLPYAIAATKVIRYLADAIAGLFGFVLPEVDDNPLGNLGDSGEDASDSIDGATESAKKLKKTLLGIDELNVMPDTSGGDSETSGTGFDFKLPEYSSDFINEAVTSRVDEIVEKMKEWLGITGDIKTWADLFDTKLGDILLTVGAIGVGIAAWKVSAGLMSAINTIKNLASGGITFSIGLIGAVAFMADLDKLKQYLEDYSENGATFSNVAGMIGEFAGLIGDAMLLLGNVQTGAALKAVQGIGEIASAISDIANEGANFDNVLDVIRGMTNVGLAISMFTGNIKWAGISMAFQGWVTIIDELQENWDAIKNGDWSGVDKATLVIGAIEVFGGIVTALGVFNKIKAAVDTGKAVKGVKDVVTTTETISTTTSTLTTKLTTLVKNLGLGIAIIAEVAAAAALIVGAIWLLGWELEKVGVAWEPVIANAETVAIAVGVGTGLLVAVGVVTAALGAIGPGLCANLGIGIAILAEIGVATGLFVAEVWAIGWGLSEVLDAWQPVLDNTETVEAAIIQGTALLVAVGAATALLGVATTATGGALPAAIGLGTAILAEMGIAAGLFIAEIWAIGKGLDEVGEAWTPVLDNGDTIKSGIKLGTTILIAIGAATAVLGAASVASVGLLPVAIGLGTLMLEELGEAFDTFVDEMVDVATKLTDDLAPALNGMNEDLPGLSEDMDAYTDFMGDLAKAVVAFTLSNAISGIAATIDKVVDFFTTDPIKRLSDEVNDQKKQMDSLVANLDKTIPVIENADRLLGEFNGAMANLKATAGIKGGSGGTIGYVLSIGVELLKKGNWKDIASFVGNKVEVGVSLVKDGWKSITDLIGNLATTLKIKLPHVSVDWVDTGFMGVKYPDFSVSYYAKGGFPTEGEMFIAREAGPELVGSIGNRTAVANNDQIVDSVSKGVYQAVVRAMSQSGGSQTVEAKVNDKVLFEVVVNRNRQETMRTGYNPLLGGV